MNKESTQRNYGIDLLRIVAMIMIVMIHSNNFGGLMSSSTGLNLKISWFIHVLVYGAVNCYAMISGYVGMSSKHKYANIMYLYLQVIFYTVLITAAFYFLKPNSATVKNIFEGLLPFVYDHYWYFTLYFGMFFFMPFMNILLNALNKQNAKILALSLIIIFSVIPCVFRKDIFKTMQGYSVIWISAMYLLGGCIKIVEPEKKIKKRTAFIIYLAVSVITFISTLFDGVIKKETFLFSYTSPTILIASVALFIIFINTDINERFKKLIAFFSPLTFGVYLIHTHPHIWRHIFYNRFSYFGDKNPVVFVLATIAVSVGVWLLCSAIDYIRLIIFKKIHLKELCISIENKLPHI